MEDGGKKKTPLRDQFTLIGFVLGIQTTEIRIYYVYLCESSLQVLSMDEDC
jgi:hypothetical protein